MKQDFSRRHIGLSEDSEKAMLAELGFSDLDEMTSKIVPKSIQFDSLGLDLESMSESDLRLHITDLLAKNQVCKSFIGQGYYGTVTPAVIQRNILENPGWYTAYTPYQAEIAQGRLEALFNFQTVITELTGMPMANASLLDEGTAAAEAMMMLHRVKFKRGTDDLLPQLFIDQHVFTQTKNVVINKAEALDIEVTIGDWTQIEDSQEFFACIVQYPNAIGSRENFASLKQTHPEMGIVVCADLLCLALFEPPVADAVDVFVGTTQRLGVPMWYGGPHAAYFATHDRYKRNVPGRIIGLSKDAEDNPAFRMALQTREQHIKREKATSNICTAQALLAIMSSFYALYHGPNGLRNIALNIYSKHLQLSASLSYSGYKILNTNGFDTVTVELDPAKLKSIQSKAEERGYLFYYTKNEVRISLDETATDEDLSSIQDIFGVSKVDDVIISEENFRSDAYMEQEVFHAYDSETSMMRYMKKLENRDFSLVHGMIPLGSCTMKLNAASELLALSNPAMSAIHPFTPAEKVSGYTDMIRGLSSYLSEITGLAACSLQPNSGAQGEYAGLLCIKDFLHKKGVERDIMLIPYSAHGTNPASAVSAGFEVAIVPTDDGGNIDMTALHELVMEHSERLAGIMVTYPSTHGIFEERIKELCDLIHDHGGLVYMDGANMNAQVGLTSPGYIGADVCHLNLHKTFAIPHGGGGPGVGPICVTSDLEPYLPKQDYYQTNPRSGAVSSAEYGSAGILEISYAYIRLLGSRGLKKATQVAILSANYLKSRLEEHFEILYKDYNGFVGHEFIVDLRPFKEYNVSAEDVAKRLMDYGFHAPTLSFPVPGTLMIEPTESEDRKELDRFIAAMISIREEIGKVVRGEWSQENNPLVNAPHTQVMIVTDDWSYPYSREEAVYPLGLEQSQNKFWPSVRRVDNAYGDRNLICSCPPTADYMGT